MGNQFAQAGVMVSVLMPAFNHGKYIRQAIESFLAQQQVEAGLIIGNDASTDDTLQIAAEYADKFPDRIQVISNPHNMGLIGNYKSLLENSSSRYIAILESDDYWTDPLKLHKQVAYLEAHPECGLVYTSGEFVDEAGKHLGVKKEISGALSRNRLLQQVLMANPVLAVTACFRREAFEKGCCMADKWAVMRYFPWVFRIKKRKLIGTGTVHRLSR